MYEDELSGHRVMADPDDSTQESSAWMGKSMGGRGYNQGGEIHTQPQKKEFEVPRASAAVRTEALRRTQAALNKVPDATHYDEESERTAVTLFAGNLDFKARDANRFSLRNYFPSDRWIRVENIVIPRYKKGCAFITLTWAQAALVDPADLCVALSGEIQVNSRFLYLQEPREDVANKKHMKSFHNRLGIPTGSSGDGFYLRSVGL